MIFGEKSERQDQSSFFFLENIIILKSLPRAPEFEYAPLSVLVTIFVVFVIPVSVFSILYSSVLQTFFIETHFSQANFFATPKKGSSPRINLSDSAIFPKIKVFSKKKKGLHFDFISDFPVFSQNQGVL